MIKIPPIIVPEEACLACLTTSPPPQAQYCFYPVFNNLPKNPRNIIHRISLFRKTLYYAVHISLEREGEKREGEKIIQEGKRQYKNLQREKFKYNG